MQCHICNGETLMFTEIHNATVCYCCKACKYIFKDPSCYQPLDKQKERYDLHQNDENSDSYKAYFQRFVDFVLPFTNSPKRALDFGCGKSTLLADILKNIGISTDVYDPIYHPKNLSHSKKYDLIVSTEVFEHLHQPKEVFASLVARLNPGGFLAIQTAFHPEDTDAFKTWYYHRDPTHIVFFSPKTFKRLGQMYGCVYVADNGKNMVVLKRGEKMERKNIISAYLKE
ncbi:Methyltransferase-related protein [hydrothermal vent metagenome]|uniref:Methyltransferase-related protein n=1 Tax=hydrothermal vent metagenome TaxID=652676 RepID=A0A1W1EAY7_9ZZZZ